MTEILAIVFALLGVFFMIVGSFGLVRLPDLYTRMSATAKTSTIGVSMFMLATAVYFEDTGVTGRVLAVIVFIFLTSPISSHLIARAGYLDGVKLWEGSVRDDLAGRYDLVTRELSSKEMAFADEQVPSAEPPPGFQPSDASDEQNDGPPKPSDQ